jgi:hypothetical protein
LSHGGRNAKHGKKREGGQQRTKTDLSDALNVHESAPEKNYRRMSYFATLWSNFGALHQNDKILPG